MGFPIDTDLNVDKISEFNFKFHSNTLICNFCGKSHLECRKLIAGPDVMICDECIEISVFIIRETYPEFVKTKNG